MRAIASLCLLAAAVLLPGLASAAPTCRLAERVIAEMEQHPNYAGHTVLDEAQAKIAAGIYNALPPETDDPWNHVVLFDGKAGDGMMIVGNDSKLCSRMAVPARHWPTLKRTILGETS